MNGNRWSVLRSALVLVAVGAAACGSDSNGPEQPGPPAVLTVVSGSGQEGESGEALPTALTVKASDLEGRAVPRAVVTFVVAAGGGSLSQAIDTTDAGGLASTQWTMGGSLGAAQVTARITGLLAPAVFTATVKAGPPAAATRVSALVGSSAGGFEVADSVAIKVTDRFQHPVAGATVTFAVTAGSGTVSHATKVTGTDGVARTAWKLGATGAQTLRAASGALTVDVTASAVTCSETAIAVGQVLSVTPGTASCLVTVGTGAQKYVVAVSNSSTFATSSSSFLFRGDGGSASTSPVTTPASSTLDLGNGVALRFGGALTRPMDAHVRIMRANAELLARFGSRRIEARPDAKRQAVPLPNVGDMVSIKIPAEDNICVNSTSIRARVVYVGTRSVILEDSASQVSGQMDAEFRRVGETFDNGMFPVLETNFGNPLAIDAQLDANDRVFMVFTPRVNTMAGGTIAGFVSAADLLPAQCPASNNGEYFYARVPTSLNTAFDEGSLGEWKWSTPTVMTHELKHVTSYAEKLSRGWMISSAWQVGDLWLEEGSAMIAEELWSRKIYGYGADQNVVYQGSISCELDLLRSVHRAECPTESVSGMLDHFAFLYDYLDDAEHRSAIGPIADDDASFYGSSWMFLRWLLDSHSTDDSGLLRAINSETMFPGTRNIEARTSRSFPDLFADFALAVALDDYPSFTAADTRYSIAGWNTRSIFAGLNSERNVVINPAFFMKPVPLVPRATSFGRFVVNVSGVVGGGFSIFEISGTTTNKQLLEFKGPSGSGFPAEMRVRVARVQ